MNEYVVTVNGIKKQVRFLNGTEIFIDDVRYEYEIIKLTAGSYLLRLNNNFYEIPLETKNSHSSIVSVGGETFEIMVRSLLQEKAASIIEQKSAASLHMEVKSPMPGMIIKINMSRDSQVTHGDAVLILEAMKMENEVRSPFNGTLKEIYVKEGMAVEKGAKLFLIE
jgi:glutaconyl-CoA/methylmalonyl-CoA decarboxylase subunit gamma